MNLAELAAVSMAYSAIEAAAENPDLTADVREAMMNITITLKENNG